MILTDFFLLRLKKIDCKDWASHVSNSPSLFTEESVMQVRVSGWVSVLTGCDEGLGHRECRRFVSVVATTDSLQFDLGTTSQQGVRSTSSVLDAE